MGPVRILGHSGTDSHPPERFQEIECFRQRSIKHLELKKKKNPGWKTNTASTGIFFHFSTAGSELPLNATRWHHLLARGSFVLKCSQGLGRFLGNVNEGDPPPRRPPVHVQILGEVLGTHTRYPTLRLLAGRCFPTLLVPPAAGQRLTAMGLP